MRIQPIRWMIMAALIVLPALASAGEEGDSLALADKRVVMVLASQQFRDEELCEPLEILQEMGAGVLLASSTLEQCRGMLGMEVKPDILLDSLRAKDFDAIVFVGGTGAQEYWADTTAHRLARAALDSGKVVGAICIAPVTLANAGVLSGKRATIWSSERGTLEAAGAIYTGTDVEVDGKLITANGPGAAGEFGRQLVQALLE